MSATPPRRRFSRKHFADLAPLRQSRSFAMLWAGGAISGIGSQMTIVAVGLHIYDLTHSTFAVAMVGAFALVPMVFAGLYGGMLADAFDRRLILLCGAIVAWGSTLGLASLAWLGVETVWPFYLLTTLNAISATVIGTVRVAVVPRILPAHLLPAAFALNGISFGIMLTVGPALAGVLVATVGFSWTYTIDAFLFVFAFLGILSLPRLHPEGETQRPGLSSLKSGLRFLRAAPNIRMGFLLDIIAMTFGQPRALFPAVGALLLGGGAITVGILISAGAVGTFLSGVFSGQVGAIRLQGRAIGRAIVVYGACILGFGALLTVVGLSPYVPIDDSFDHAHLPAIAIAAVLLAAAGAADNISAIFRTTMLQTAVPDNVRGRLQGVYTIVVTGGPRLGDIYVGIVAAAGLLWLPPLLGGVVIVVLVATLVRVHGTFRHYDALKPTP